MNILEQILEICTDCAGFMHGAAKNKYQGRELVMVRNLYFKYAKEFTKYSLAQIGMLVKKNHSTVVHGLKTIENDISLIKEISDLHKRTYPIIKDAVIRAQNSKLDETLSSLDTIKAMIEKLTISYQELKTELNEIKQRAEAA